MLGRAAPCLFRAQGGVRYATFSVENMNANVREMQYAVRGAVVSKAEELKVKLHKGEQLPFKEIIHCNIGNPQEVGQKPITYLRQATALLNYPEMMKNPAAREIFPQDVMDRTAEVLAAHPSGLGAYSHSQGVEIFRKWVANFISQRDQLDIDHGNIFLTDGASPGIQMVLKSLIAQKSSAILIPRPQYPLYSASITNFGGSQVMYDLDEENEWGLELSSLRNSFEQAKAQGLDPRAVCIINPGNPTGQILSDDNIAEIIDFCHSNGMVLLSDEVYQENVISPKKSWTSARKVLADMGNKYSDFQLYSFHSTSKGFLGECGKRGGYMEIANVPAPLKDQLYKLASVSLCPNLNGQATTALMCNPPKEGDESFPLYHKEKTDILESLKRRANTLSNALNSMEGVSCNPPQGAMYAFPCISLPEKACAIAKEKGVAPDLYYSMDLLENTGIVVVPGSGFGQKEGTFHFRTTFLPAEDKIDAVSGLLSSFHSNFLARHS